MNKYTVLMIVALCLFSFFTGRSSRQNTSITGSPYDTLRILKIDTVIVEKPFPKTVYVDRIIRDTLLSVDSVFVEVHIPIKKYIFTDSLYKAEVSGYKVSLDRMEVYRRTEEKTVYVPHLINNNKRWGLGVSAGYAVTPKGFQPYIGLGIQYNFIFF